MLKKFVAVVLALTCGSVYGVAPLLAGDGPMATTEAPAAVSAAPATQGSGWILTGKENNPTKAGLMSLAVPGLGQWYNGELKTWKTAAMIAAEAGSIFVLAFFAAGGAGNDAKMVCMAGAGGMIATHCVSAWDAWRTAKQNTKGLALQMDKNRTMVSYNVPF
ncbi:MAG: DUF5683 domain-containing protein [Candidatus Aureabacteria bacterium]|nr:DUF5683 domain-containing protein [Candidatus Auribacterota bacterium]